MAPDAFFHPSPLTFNRAGLSPSLPVVVRDCEQPMTLTARQAAILTWIRNWIAERGYSPTVREIAAAFDISSPNGVVTHLKALAKKGAIRWEPNLSRTITITEQTV
jgi:DNA-binding MarR family transcriptional regulator